MRRVIVSGMDVATGFGLGVAAFWNGLVEGSNAIRPIERFDASTLPVQIAADVPDFDYACHAAGDPGLFYPEPESFAVRFSLCAVYGALRDAGLDYRRLADPTRVGVFVADRETSPVWQIADTAPLQVAASRDGRTVDRTTFRDLVWAHRIGEKRKLLDRDRLSVVIPRRLGIEGPNLAVGTACASSNNAIGEAAGYIREGLIDVALVGGSYELDLQAMIGFARLGALTPNPDPDTACRPFDRRRDGFVMASGCGILVLENLEHARRRGAPILAEVGGYGGYCDAYRATDPHPEADGAYASIRACLGEARLAASEVDYVAAHGTSTRLNDRTETIAIKRALGEHAWRLPVSTTKSMIGHTIMAAGALQAVAAIKSIETGIVHGTRNLAERDVECDLDYVSGGARECSVRTVLSNSFGFGGQNACLILTRFS